MFTLSHTQSFVAAMRLPNNTGPCGRLHGHTYEVTITVARNELNDDGMVIDYHELGLKLNAVLAKLDHNFLNDLEYFKDIAPTSENIAKYIYIAINLELKAHGVKVSTIEIAEDRNVKISYHPE